MRAGRYIPDSSAPSGLATRTSMRKWRLRSSTSGAMAASWPLNVSPGFACTEMRRHADPQPAGFQLRDAGLELHLPQVGDDDDRLVARNRARVVVALDDEAGDRRLSVASRCTSARGAARPRPARGSPGQVALGALARCAVSAASSR